MPSNTPKISKKPTEDKKKDKIKSPDFAPPVGSFSPEWLWTSKGISESSDADGTVNSTTEEVGVTRDEKKISHHLDNQVDILIQYGSWPWTRVLQTVCDFEPHFFLIVMENLLRNPNITSSSLFRADILYDSAQDKEQWDQVDGEGGFVKWMQKDLQPRRIIVESKSGLKLKRTVVRKLVPRKPWVDPELCQTVHFLEDKDNNDVKAKNVIVYIPHVESKDKIPFYHPQVRALVLCHSYAADSSPKGSLDVSYQLFSPTDMDSHQDSEISESTTGLNRLQRTALNFLRIVHKHATGQKAGYTKRVHHDLVVPQKRFQDTYTALKAKYSQKLLDAWAEVTDPLKHVFEDLGIAAFLIEVWRDLYNLPPRGKSGHLMGGGPNWKGNEKSDKPPFPGFVDVGCGNGVLVYILISEGFEGWGFDARNRKSWDVFPKEVQECLQQRILIPQPFVNEVQDHEILQEQASAVDSKDSPKTHDGTFKKGTFIISNHADQLTIWTPLMAFLSDCPFISIPCCSHGLSGKLQRFYDLPPGEEGMENSRSSNDTVTTNSTEAAENDLLTSHENHSIEKDHPANTSKASLSSSGLPKKHAPEKGSLLPRKPGPSAYAGFSAHIMRIARDLGFVTRQEILRIPSTRNLCVFGLIPSTISSSAGVGEHIAVENRDKSNDSSYVFDKTEKDVIIAKMIKQEVNGDVNKAARDWMDEALSLIKPKTQKKRDAHANSEPSSTVQKQDDSNKQVLQRGYKSVLGLEKLEDWEIDLLRPS